MAATGTAQLGDRGQLTRAVIASTIGTSIEWYDFFLYSLVTPLVFAKLFFPNSDPLVGVLQAFAIYAVGFVARPVGAAIFGHYGDRIGRKATLIATLALMGVATFLVGFVPGYAQIGIWGAIILTVLRFVQGVGVGGEWGGSVLLSMEWASTNARRGLIASWPQFGVPAGLFLANLAVLGFSLASGPAFLDWGWRIPFLLSIVLVGIGLWIRIGIIETPTFRRLLSEDRIEKAPVREVFRVHGREIVLSALARMAEQAPFYIFTAFVFTYGTQVLNQPRNLLVTALLVASVGSGLWIPLFGHISDQIGRRKTYLIGCVVTAVFGFLYFAMLDTGLPAMIFLGVFLADPARHLVRPAGGADRGELHAALALQRRVARIPARIDHRGRARAAHRDVAVRPLSQRLRDRGVHRAVRRDLVRGGVGDERLHGRGHPRGVRRRRRGGVLSARNVTLSLSKGEPRPQCPSTAVAHPSTGSG
jgi:MFS family permease